MEIFLSKEDGVGVVRNVSNQRLCYAEYDNAFPKGRFKLGAGPLSGAPGAINVIDVPDRPNAVVHTSMLVLVDGILVGKSVSAMNKVTALQAAQATVLNMILRTIPSEEVWLTIE